MTKNIVYNVLSEEEYQKFRNIIAKTDKENLRTFYSVQSEWIRHYNNMSWGVGAVLVPLSFSGLALASQEDKIPILCVAIASIFLLIYWHVTIIWQRRLWKQCLSVTSIIEEYWDIREKSSIATTSPISSLKSGSDYGAYLRLLIVITGVFLWLFRIQNEIKILK